MAFAQESGAALSGVSVYGADTGGRVDLAPDNPANFARLAPSSRPHAETFARPDIDALKPADVFDLLGHATGVVATYQGRKLGHDLMIRGDSNYAYVIDGAYVPVSTAGRLLQTLPVSAIEQVDIVRDATALTLGPLVGFDSASGALNSGFVVIRTRRPDKTGAELRGAAESYGTLAASGYAGAAVGGEPGKPGFYLSGLMSHKRTDGPAGYNMWGESTTGQITAGGTAGIFSTDLEVFQDHTRYGFERAQAGQSAAALVAQRWSYAPINSTLVTSNSKLTWDAHNLTLFTLSYNSVSAKNVQASYTSPAVATNQDNTDTVSANLRHNFQVDRTLVQVGGEYVHFQSPTGQLFYSGYAHAEQTFSGYVQAEQGLFEGRLTLDASVRFDSHEILQGIDLYNQGNGGGAAGTGGAAGSGGGTGAGTGGGSGSKAGGSGSKAGGGAGSGSPAGGSPAPSTTVAYRYFYDRTLPLAQNLAGGITFRIMPQLTATGRYSHTEQGAISGIPSADGRPLDPEVQNRWEIGLEAPLSDAFRPALNLFDSRIDNDKTPTRYQTINGFQTALWSQSDTERRGFELLAHGALASDVVGFTTYRASWMHLTDVRSSTIATYAATVPRDVVNVSLTQSWKAYSGTVSLNHVSSYQSNFNSADGLYHAVGNFTVLDLRIGRSFDLGPVKANLSVYGRNLTNHKYETVYGFPSWGSVFGSELTLNF